MKQSGSGFAFTSATVFVCLFMLCGWRAGWFQHDLLTIGFVAVTAGYTGYFIYPFVNRLIREPRACAAIVFGIVAFPWSLVVEPPKAFSFYALAIPLLDLAFYAALGLTASIWAGFLVKVPMQSRLK